MSLEIIDLLRKDYIFVLGYQLKIFHEKQLGFEDRDFLILVEHFPVYTCGKSTKKEHFKDINQGEIITIERGGSVTFHGLGQIVIYPIIDIHKRKLSVKRYIWKLEESMIKTLTEIGIEAFRVEGKRGVFTKKGKIGFVGVRVSKGITMHGISLNVDVDKNFFNKIIPCGLDDTPISNVSDFLDNHYFDDIKKLLIKHLQLEF
ncbi:MAG: lipoyl(octanoyl) transferase LipB [Aquificae bacterium]|nr:lipoyl(octanoyl) transferase LipB [Aquificota bacterium]